MDLPGLLLVFELSCLILLEVALNVVFHCKCRIYQPQALGSLNLDFIQSGIGGIEEIIFVVNPLHLQSVGSR